MITLVSCRHQGFSRPEETYKQARQLLERGELLPALGEANKGLAKFGETNAEWRWRFRELQAEILVWQGKAKDALALLESDLPPALANDQEAAIRRRLTQGIANYYLQNFNDAERYLDEAGTRATSENSPLIGEVEMARGTLAAMQGDLGVARVHHLRALEIARKLGRLPLETSALGNLGYVALRSQQFGQAIDWFSASLVLTEKINNPTLRSKTLGNLGWCYYKIGDDDQALAETIEAEKAAANLGIQKDQLAWLNNLGVIQQDRGNYEQADVYYKQALAIARQLGNRSQTAVALTNLASVALERGSFDSAEQYNNEALDLKRAVGDKGAELYGIINQGRIAVGRRQTVEAERLFERVIHDSGADISLRWEAETNLAGMYAADGNESLADAQYRKALATIDISRSSLTKEEHRLSFLSTATRFYNDYIDFLVAHGREREALAVAEHSRARTLAEGLRVPVSQLSGAAFRPEQSARKLDSVVLSYWLKPGKSYLWVVTPAKVALFPLAGQNEIDAAVQEYRKVLLGPRSESGGALGQKLYQMLVAPAQALLPKPCAAAGGCTEAPRVVVIGDGSLLSLNFETLQVPEPKPHYWIEDVTINNASSVALLGASESRTSSKNGEKLLAVGDPVYAGTEFPQLTQAKLELQKVSEHFPPADRVVVEGKSAIPASYASTNPGQFGYIHFVAHGTASRISPLDSSIVLSRDGDSYKLYARDIMAQSLKAKLVTVSACYGAGNRAYTGEGLIGLSWAFMRAGAHHVIAALWEVNDLSTPQLMDTLYDNLKKGKDPAGALRAAKLALLHSDGVFRRPFYWGAFQLYSGS